MDTSYTLAARMQDYPVRDVLQVKDLMETYDAPLFQRFADQIQLQNLRIILFSQEVEDRCDQLEPIFKIKYTSQPFEEKYHALFAKPAYELAVSKKTLGLPPKNPFIPNSLAVRPASHPSLLRKSPYNTVWYKRDTNFNTPKANIFLQIQTNSPDLVSSPADQVLAEVWKEMFEVEVMELVYLAQEGQIEKKLSFNQTYLKLEVQGFSDTLHLFSEQYLKALFSFDAALNEHQFSIQLDKVVKNLENQLLDRPYQQARDFYIQFLLRRGRYDIKQLLEASKSLDFQSMKTFAAHFPSLSGLIGYSTGTWKS